MNLGMHKNFLRNGHVTLKNFLSNSDKKLIKSIIHDNFKDEIILPSLNRFNLECENFHKKLFLLRKRKPQKFGEIYDKINLNSKLRSIFYSEKFMDYFSKILNVKNNQVFLNGFMLRFDAPNDRRNKLNWHQDSPYYMMSFPKFNAGVCWCAITRNNKTNGTLQFIPKSHKKFIKVKSVKKDNFTSEQFLVKISKEEFKRVKNLDQNLGDMSMLHINLKHKSGDNFSDKLRITMACRFTDMSKSFNVGKEIYKFNNNKFN